MRKLRGCLSCQRDKKTAQMARRKSQITIASIATNAGLSAVSKHCRMSERFLLFAVSRWRCAHDFAELQREIISVAEAAPDCDFAYRQSSAEQHFGAFADALLREIF